MNDLVIDVGMNDGQDTAFYLHKGYRVLSIEANPSLCDQVSERFKNEIAIGQLTILNCAIADAAERRDFYPDWKFALGSSGPFGDDVPGTWLPFGDAIMDYMINVRDCRNNELFSSGWFDIHATLTEQPLPDGFPYPSRRKSSKIRSALWRLKRSITHRD